MSNLPESKRYETPRLTSFELVDARQLAAEFVATVVTLKDPAQQATLVTALTALICEDRNRLVDAFARVVRKVNPTFGKVG